QHRQTDLRSRPLLTADRIRSSKAPPSMIRVLACPSLPLTSRPESLLESSPRPTPTGCSPTCRGTSWAREHGRRDRQPDSSACRLRGLPRCPQRDDEVLHSDWATLSRAMALRLTSMPRPDPSG